MNRFGRFFISILLALYSFVPLTTVYAITIPDLLEKIKGNQGMVQTLQADMTTEISSSNKNIPAMKQTGRIINKYPDKSRMEIMSPIKQTTITNGTRMKIIDGQSGKSFVQDLSRGQSPVTGHQSSGMGMDPTKALENFNLKMVTDSDSEIVIESSPKEKNPYLDKMRLTFSPATFLPTRVDVYGSQGKLISSTTIIYDKVSDVYVHIQNKTSVSLPQGSMKVEVVYDKVRVNEKVSDALFGVE
jgi:outer membrane lipoprotein-sorting protein